MKQKVVSDYFKENFWVFLEIIITIIFIFYFEKGANRDKERSIQDEI